MEGRKKNIVIGVIALLLGLPTLMIFGFEIRDGVLQGSRSYGITASSSPVAFYISVILEFLVGLGLTVFGIYSLRRKD